MVWGPPKVMLKAYYWLWTEFLEVLNAGGQVKWVITQANLLITILSPAFSLETNFYIYIYIHINSCLKAGTLCKKTFKAHFYKSKSIPFLRLFAFKVNIYKNCFILLCFISPSSLFLSLSYMYCFFPPLI